ncbi:hypothetical protein XELAEV_18005575mg [Xenopus laevis]|uniref:Uncharacterized protein n=1 Tax=Xenopus laevis TaxID=8355 RepID=A0A974DX89_XENLA|nr:hypothetical protein XELAEV_18005575mg [Xenopus laevis]
MTAVREALAHTYYYYYYYSRLIATIMSAAAWDSPSCPAPRSLLNPHPVTLQQNSSQSPCSETPPPNTTPVQQAPLP